MAKVPFLARRIEEASPPEYRQFSTRLHGVTSLQDTNLNIHVGAWLSINPETICDVSNDAYHLIRFKNNSSSWKRCEIKISANNKKPSDISDFRCGVDQLAHLRCYTSYVGGYLPMFRDSLSVPSSRWRSPRPFPQSRVLEKLTLRKIHNICAACRSKRRFITASTTAQPLSIHWARSIQTTHSHQMLISVGSI
jgi:hypothetical protein